MACLIVPGVEGLAALGVAQLLLASKNGHVKDSAAHYWGTNLKTLSGYLLGGAFLLLIEHIWHGEIIFSYPFLTAMKTPEDTEVMLHEMATVGVTMALLVTSFWALTLIANRIQASRKTSIRGENA